MGLPAIREGDADARPVPLKSFSFPKTDPHAHHHH
jgi:hypothetical protein